VQLELGRLYLTRGGRKAYVSGRDLEPRDANSEFYGRVGGSWLPVFCSWDREGRVRLGSPSELDLVREVTPPESLESSQ